MLLLDDFGDEAAGADGSLIAYDHDAFKLLSDHGRRVLQAICAELEASARERADRSESAGRSTDRSSSAASRQIRVLDFFGDLAGVRLEPHPVSHYGIRVDYAPDDLARNVDQWHGDPISFDYVLIVNDPRQMKSVVSNTSSAEWRNGRS